MKRIISLMLTLVLAMAAFAACNTPQSDDLMQDVKANPDTAQNVELFDVSDAAVADFAVPVTRLADGLAMERHYLIDSQVDWNYIASLFESAV